MEARSIKAWAILRPNGKLWNEWHYPRQPVPQLFGSRRDAHDQTVIGQKAVQVLITPIPPKKRKATR